MIDTPYLSRARSRAERYSWEAVTDRDQWLLTEVYDRHWPGLTLMLEPDLEIVAVS